MGINLGFVLLDRTGLSPRRVAGAVVSAAVVASVKTAELTYAPSVSLRGLVERSGRLPPVACVVVRAAGGALGADVIAESCAGALRCGAVAIEVLDMFLSGGFQLYGPHRAGLLIDSDATIGRAALSYLDATRLGVSALLGRSIAPPRRQRRFFTERLLDAAFDDVLRFRILERGRPLVPPRAVESSDDDGGPRWDSVGMTWPMSLRAARARIARSRSR